MADEAAGQPTLMCRVPVINRSLRLDAIAGGLVDRVDACARRPAEPPWFLHPETTDLRVVELWARPEP
jgi:hypothetical protein